MQDVIFQGTTNRKQVNLCEVTLVFSDCEDKLGTAYHEVEVTRRVVRDGGSDYYLNGKVCRLKDIQRLFLDTGVGQVSYSFMLQGQIDQVLSSNPSERRAIFEEAAGIAKYKAQRREALNKLNQVDANLSRVTDVMEEVSRQIGSLKRQASKALRYKRIKHRLTHLDLALNAYHYGQIDSEVHTMEEKTGFLRKEVEKLEAELEEAERGLAGKRNQRNEINNRLQETQQKVYDLRTKKENAQNKAEFASVRKEDIKKRIGEIEKELEDLARQEKQIQDQLAGEAKVKEEQLNLFDDSDGLFQERSRELGEIQQQLSGVETELSQAKNALMAKEGAVSRLRSNCTSMEVDLKSYQVRHANLTEEIQTLKEEKEVLEQDVSKLDRSHAARLKEREAQEAKIAEFRESNQQLTHEFRELQRRLQEVDRKTAGMQAQMNVLEDLQAKFEGFSEGARNILQGKLEGVIDEDGYTLFLKNLQVDSSYTLALETLLGAAVDGVVLHDFRRLSPISEKLREDKLGRASLLFNRGEESGGSPVQAPAFLEPAWKAVSSKNPEVELFIQQYLAGCYFTEDLDTFLNYWVEHPEFSFQTVVTKAGEWVDSRGVVLAGSSKNQKKNASYLARQNQLKAYKREQKALQDEHESLKLQSDKLQQKMEAMEKKIEDQRRLVGEIGEEVTTLAAQKEGAQRNLEQAVKTITHKEAELEKLEESKAASTKRLEEARKELEETEADIEAQKKTITSCEEKVEALRQKREEKRESFNEIRVEIAEKKQRLASLDKGLEELEKQSKELESTRIRRRQEMEGLSQQIKDLEKEGKDQEAVAKEVDGELAGLMETLEKDRNSLKEVEQAIETVENGFSSKRESNQKLSTELNKVEVALARQQSRQQFICEELQREYEVNPQDIDWKQELWMAGDSLPDRIRVDIEDEDPEDMEALEDRGEPSEEDLKNLENTDWNEVEEEVKSLRTRIQSMGPVNLVAIEEYKELKQRYEFLKEQSTDLWNSKEQLLNAIDEINTTSQELFAATFEKIRDNFRYTFETLFGGGKSDLKLIDAEDVLESGIEISAQPPGTRLKSLALLSGGQKTMTAVALLFAIYMVKPSPFCVLDEIDAPLDDANIGRFTKMLHEFLQYSQFLIITHNKRTISVADTIYGTTMQEKGVSRVVSMRFNRATGKAEALEESPQESEEEGAGI